MKKYIIIFLSFLLVMTSCLKDNTVTERGDVELPVLDNPDQELSMLATRKPYKLKVGDVLSIDANITYSNPDALSYRWVIDGKTIPEDKVNGTYRNHLKWTCDIDHNASAALYVTMTTHKSGKPIDTIFRFYIEIDHPYEKGIMIAMDKDGKIVYNFLQHILAKPFVEHANAYVSDMSSDSWLKLEEFWSNEASNVIGHRFHLDKDPLKCHTIETGLKLDSKISLEQEFMTMPADLEISDISFAGYVGYILDKEHQVYARKSQKGYYTGRYSAQPLRYENEVLHISKFSDGSYKLGILIAYDMDNERFLTINTAYNDQTNRKAGMISEIPEGVDLNKFKGEDIIYMRLISADFWGDPTFFIISRNKLSGNYSASEYEISVGDGVIFSAKEKYYKSPLSNFGDNTKYLVLDSPSYGMGYIYYTDNADARILRYAKRSSTGVDGYGEYAKFSAEIVSLDQSKIGRRAKLFTAGFNDRSVKVFDLTYSMDKFTPPSVEDPGQNNSLLHEWKDLPGDVLQVNYCYGNVAEY